jgi:hypothetical protein
MKKLAYTSIALILLAGCATHASKPQATTPPPQAAQLVPTVVISRTLAEPSPQRPAEKVISLVKEETASKTSSKPTTPWKEVEPAGTEAVLTASDLGAQINLRATPEISGKYLGYGIQGDRVQVIKQTAVNERTWYKVRFPQSTAVGWIRGDFVRVTSDQPPSDPATSPSGSEATSDTYYTPVIATSGDRCSLGYRCGRRASSVRRRR